MKICGLDIHPAANLFPMLDGNELDALAADIERHGQLAPIVVYRGAILDGRNRARACEKLGRRPVSQEWDGHGSPTATVISLNVKRRHLNAAQLAAVARDAVPMFAEENRRAQAQAGERGGRLAGKGRPQGGGQSAPMPKPPRDESARSTAKAAAATGAGEKATKAALRWTEDVAKAVKVGTVQTVAEATALSKLAPEKRAEVLTKAAEAPRVGAVKQAIRQASRDEATAKINAEPEPLPTGPFRVLVADPPWQYEKRVDDGTHRSALSYPSMTTDEICAMPVAPLGCADSVLWLWTTNAHMRDAFRVLDAWGYSERTILTWAKDRWGTGDWLRGQTEHCIMAARGKPVLSGAQSSAATLLRAPMREHSRKPEEFYALVESVCPGSKCELFARAKRAGWTSWGAESEKFGASK